MAHAAHHPDCDIHLLRRCGGRNGERRVAAIDTRSPVRPPAPMRVPEERRPDSDAPAPRGRNRTPSTGTAFRAHRTPADPQPCRFFPAAHQPVYFACAVRQSDIGRATSGPPVRLPGHLDLGRGRCGIVACTAGKARDDTANAPVHAARGPITIVRSPAASGR